MWKRRYAYLDSVAGEPAAGGGASPGAVPATPVAEPSMLTSAVAATAPAVVPGAAPAPVADPNDPLAWIPEKYRVPGAEGKVDVHASAIKINEARAALEKRMGEGGLPPETADAYKPDGALAALKEKTGKNAAIPPALLKDFNAWAHDAKLSQAQYDKALTGFVGGGVQQMVDAAYDQAMAKGKVELGKVWGAPESEGFKANIALAVNAFNKFAPPALRTPAVMDQIGNHPVVLQMLAAVGKELGEDRKIPGGAAPAGTDINTIMNSRAYWDPMAPGHAATIAQVSEFFSKGGKRAA